MTTAGIVINEDNEHFYASRTTAEMTKEQVEGLVDFYSNFPQVREMMFCVNVQRALFDSSAWQPLWDGFDFDGSNDQPCLQWCPKESRPSCRRWVENVKALTDRHIDHFAIWLAKCREHGISGWLSMRMNDVHYVDHPEAFWHNKLWKDRPDLRIEQHKFDSWDDGAFDYAKPEVREHHMSLIRELAQRFDFDGLELDWMRWGRCFRTGDEEKTFLFSQILLPKFAAC